MANAPGAFHEGISDTGALDSRNRSIIVEFTDHVVDRLERPRSLELQCGAERIARRQPQQAAPQPVPLTGFAHPAPRYGSVQLRT